MSVWIYAELSEENRNMLKMLRRYKLSDELSFLDVACNDLTPQEAERVLGKKSWAEAEAGDDVLAVRFNGELSALHLLNSEKAIFL